MLCTLPFLLNQLLRLILAFTTDIPFHHKLSSFHIVSNLSIFSPFFRLIRLKKKKKLLLPINACPVHGHPVLFSRPVTCLTRCTRLPRRSRTTTSSPTRPRQWHIVNCCPLLEFTKRAAVSLSAKNFLPKHFWMFYLYAIFIFRFIKYSCFFSLVWSMQTELFRFYI